MDEVSLKSLENLTTLQNKFQTLANQALLNGSAGNGLATTKRETRVCIEELSQQLFFLGTHTLDVLDKQTQEVDTLDVKLSSVHTVSNRRKHFNSFVAHENNARGSEPRSLSQGVFQAISSVARLYPRLLNKLLLSHPVQLVSHPFRLPQLICLLLQFTLR